MILSSRFRSNTESSCRPWVSAYKLHCLLFFCRAKTGRKVSFFLSFPNVLSLSSLSGRSALPYNWQSHFESCDVIIAELDRNHLNKSRGPRNDLSEITMFGTCKQRKKTFSVSLATLSLPDVVCWPRKSIRSEKAAHFCSIIVTPASLRRRSTYIVCFTWSLVILEKITISWRYTRAYCISIVDNNPLINLWNVAHAFFKPNGIVINWHNPWWESETCVLPFSSFACIRTLKLKTIKREHSFYLLSWHY